MSRESTAVQSEPDSQPQESRRPTEADWIAESTDSSEEGFSLVDPLTYAPLLLVGAALVVIPEPATTLIGVVCLAVGVLLLAVDILSSDVDSD